jgi:hypothetical protein
VVRWGVLTADLSRRAGALLREFGVSSISQQARTVVTVTEPLSGVAHVESIVQRAFGAAQEALARRAVDDASLMERANRFAERVARMYVVVVEDLQVAYRLALGDDVVVGVPAVRADFAVDGDALVLRGGAVRLGAHVADGVFGALAQFVVSSVERCLVDAASLAKMMAFDAARPGVPTPPLPPMWKAWQLAEHRKATPTVNRERCQSGWSAQSKSAATPAVSRRRVTVCRTSGRRA